MKKLTDGTYLYHGSYCEVRKPEISMCARNKDFGQGFYLTTSLEQARNFAKLSTRKAISNGNLHKSQNFGIVSRFQYHPSEEIEDRTFLFDFADTEWLHFVVGHRRKNTFAEIIERFSAYDIIGGKIANDNTNATITAYMMGVFGDTGSMRADEICISLLIPERLENQFCFRTELSLSLLTFMEAEKVWI